MSKSAVLNQRRIEKRREENDECACVIRDKHEGDYISVLTKTNSFKG